MYEEAKMDEWAMNKLHAMLDPWLKQGPPEEGDLAVWRTTNFPGPPRWFAVPDPFTGAFFIQALTIADLGNDEILTNAMGLCIYEDGEWTEWYDEEGEEIDIYITEVGNYQRVQNNRREHVVAPEMTAEERDQTFLPKGKIVKADSDQ